MKTGLIILGWCLSVGSGFAQGFVNLDFEQARNVPLGYGTMAAADGLPGWTIYNNYLGNIEIIYNTFTVGSPAVSIHNGGSPYSVPILQGSFTAFLQPSAIGGAPAAIGQVGTIPINSQSLRFFASGSLDPVLSVSFAGQPLPIYRLGGLPNGAVVYGANIAPFAGQSGELRFTAPTAGITFGTSLDNIFFSNTPVPEPCTWALLALGTALFARVARRRRR